MRSSIPFAFAAPLVFVVVVVVGSGTTASAAFAFSAHRTRRPPSLPSSSSSRLPFTFAVPPSSVFSASRAAAAGPLRAEESSESSTSTEAAAAAAVESSPSDKDDEEGEDEEDDEGWEYEEVEFESLSEEDYYDSEWRIGTVLDSNADKIVETWCRLKTEDGANVAVWGDGSKGKWSIDVPSQFFSVSKETFGGWGGKKIWAGTAEDYYYLEGTVRGWSPISPASVLGQWQGRRLGVQEGEAGIAPWFERDENDEEEENEEGNEEKEEKATATTTASDPGGAE